MQPLDR